MVKVELTEHEAKWIKDLIEGHVINNPVRQGYARRVMADNILTNIALAELESADK